MFRDAKEELERLEAELLAAEHEDAQNEWNDQLLEEFLAEEDDGEVLADYLDDPIEFGAHDNTIYRNYSNNYGRDLPRRRAYNSDRVDEDIPEYSDRVYKAKPENIKGLMVTAVVLLAGILGMLAFWAVRYL